MDRNTAKDLDKFYTKKIIAQQCFDLLKAYAEKYIQNPVFIEPSAGSGSFLFDGVIGFDLYPEDPRIIKNDFINDDFSQYILGIDNIVFLGNPPFGKKGLLSTQFINKAFQYSNFVGFILPIQYNKWSGQTQIIPNAKLVMNIILPENSFEFLGNDYNVRCCFQIWTTYDVLEPNLRIQTKPPTSHPDFELFQYNRTQQSEKYFDLDWDFAVIRQGFHNYNDLKFNKEDCNRKYQWIFFKAKSPEVLDKLKSIDFNKLSKLNTSIPGFGKADVIAEYTKNK